LFQGIYPGDLGKDTKIGVACLAFCFTGYALKLLAARAMQVDRFLYSGRYAAAGEEGEIELNANAV